MKYLWPCSGCGARYHIPAAQTSYTCGICKTVNDAATTALVSAPNSSGMERRFTGAVNAVPDSPSTGGASVLPPADPPAPPTPPAAPSPAPVLPVAPDAAPAAAVDPAAAIRQDAEQLIADQSRVTADQAALAAAAAPSV
jgi:hypothetical protein